MSPEGSRGTRPGSVGRPFGDVTLRKGYSRAECLGRRICSAGWEGDNQPLLFGAGMRSIHRRLGGPDRDDG